MISHRTWIWTHCYVLSRYAITQHEKKNAFSRHTALYMTALIWCSLQDSRSNQKFLSCETNCHCRRRDRTIWTQLRVRCSEKAFLPAWSGLGYRALAFCKSGALDPQVTGYLFLLFGWELLLSPISHRMSDKGSFQITYCRVPNRSRSDNQIKDLGVDSLNTVQVSRSST